jgi:hypothetical protein
VSVNVGEPFGIIAAKFGLVSSSGRAAETRSVGTRTKVFAEPSAVVPSRPTSRPTGSGECFTLTGIPDKAASNEAKHGVAFSEAATAFGDPLSLTIPAREQSEGGAIHPLGGNLPWSARRCGARRSRRLRSHHQRPPGHERRATIL